MGNVKRMLALMGCVAAGFCMFLVPRGTALAQSELAELRQSQEEPTSHLATLYAHDDLLSAFSFRSGTAGGRVQGGEIDLSRAQIAFHMFAEDMLSFGFVGHEAVNVIDLGDLFVPGFVSARDLAPKFPPSVFHTLVLDGHKVSYRGAGDRLLRLKEGQRIFDPLPREGLYHLQPILGHTYLMRVEPRGADEELYKFQVVDFVPGHRLTLRWGRIPEL